MLNIPPRRHRQPHASTLANRHRGLLEYIHLLKLVTAELAADALGGADRLTADTRADSAQIRQQAGRHDYPRQRGAGLSAIST